MRHGTIWLSHDRTYKVHYEDYESRRPSYSVPSTSFLFTNSRLSDANCKPRTVYHVTAGVAAINSMSATWSFPRAVDLDASDSRLRPGSTQFVTDWWQWPVTRLLTLSCTMLCCASNCTVWLLCLFQTALCGMDLRFADNKLILQVNTFEYVNKHYH